MFIGMNTGKDCAKKKNLVGKIKPEKQQNQGASSSIGGATRTARGK
jgi:hypothetical protein